MRGPGRGQPSSLQQSASWVPAGKCPPEHLTKPLSEIRGHENLWRQGVQPTYTQALSPPEGSEKPRSQPAPGHPPSAQQGFRPGPASSGLSEVRLVYRFLSCGLRGQGSLYLQTQPQGNEGSGRWQPLWQHRALPDGNCSRKLRDAPQPQRCPKAEDRDHRAPPPPLPYQVAQTHSCVSPQTFGVSFMTPFPSRLTQTPSQVKAVDTGQLTDRAALRPHGGSGEGHSGNNQERRRQSRFGGAPSGRVMRTHGVHLLVH